MQWRRVSFADTATWGTYDAWVCVACHRIEERAVIALCACVLGIIGATCLWFAW